MIDDLHRQLAWALRNIATGTAPGDRSATSLVRDLRMACDIARDAVSTYDAAVAAEQREAERATEKLLGVDDDGQHGVGA